MKRHLRSEPSSIQGGDAAYEIGVTFGPCSSEEAEEFFEAVSDFVLDQPSNYGACTSLARDPAAKANVPNPGVADVLSEDGSVYGGSISKLGFPYKEMSDYDVRLALSVAVAVLEDAEPHLLLDFDTRAEEAIVEARGQAVEG